MTVMCGHLVWCSGLVDCGRHKRHQNQAGLLSLLCFVVGSLYCVMSFPVLFIFLSVSVE